MLTRVYIRSIVMVSRRWDGENMNEIKLNYNYQGHFTTPAESRMLADMRREFALASNEQTKRGVYTVQIRRNGHRVARRLIAKGLVVECTEEHPLNLLSIKFPA